MAEATGDALAAMGAEWRSALALSGCLQDPDD